MLIFATLMIKHYLKPVLQECPDGDYDIKRPVTDSIYKRYLIFKRKSVYNEVVLICRYLENESRKNELKNV